MHDTQLPLLPLVLDRIPAGLSQALAQEGIPCVERRHNRVDGRFVVYDSRSGSIRGLASGQIAIDADDLRKGWQGNPFEDLLDERSGRFGWRIGGFHVREEVARIEKRSVRRHVMQALRTKLESHGGIWFRIGAYPFPYRSAFNLRFDHDEYDAADFDNTLRAISGVEHATSHFVCASTHEAHPEAIARLRGMDLGSHGYLHHTYQDTEDNLRNIRRGIDALRQLGAEPGGFVAPHGRFNLALLTAMESLGITHSSEFGLAYDELPFFPAGGDVLQVPIHPICLGIFLEAAANRQRQAKAVADDSAIARKSAELWFDQVATGDSSIRRLGPLEAQRGVLNRDQEQTVGHALIESAVDAAAEHLSSVARAKYQLGEPIFFYGHPNGRVGRHPRFLKSVLGTVADFAALWMTNMSEVNRWWRLRKTARVRVLAAEGGFQVVMDHCPRGFRLAGEYWRGEHLASIPLDAPIVRLLPDSLAFQSRRQPSGQSMTRIDQAHTFRGSVRRYLDYEKVTPVDEISTRNWRGWMKRTLRRMRDPE